MATVSLIDTVGGKRNALFGDLGRRFSRQTDTASRPLDERRERARPPSTDSPFGIRGARSGDSGICR
ncbi:MAG: hypothetical protein M1297_08180 [Nitrospirae bacterium]|nr:hypothetical protein [Nitrospirota bacterium]